MLFIHQLFKNLNVIYILNYLLNAIYSFDKILSV